MITLSCQHEVEESSEGIDVAIADYDSEKRAVTTMLICGSCFEAFDRTGIILKTEQEQNDYLNGR